MGLPHGRRSAGATKAGHGMRQWPKAFPVLRLAMLWQIQEKRSFGGQPLTGGISILESQFVYKKKVLGSTLVNLGGLN